MKRLVPVLIVGAILALDWWHALPDDSYTKKLAMVNVYVVAPVDVLAPWSVPS